MANEIERKFLIKDPEAFLSLDWTFGHVSQYYIIDDERGELRVNSWSDEKNNDFNYKMCHKTNGSNSLVRNEYECHIGKESFEILKRLSIKHSIKNRFYGHYNGIYIEVDDFWLGNEGELLLAEIEFDTEEEAIKFDPLTVPWLGEEVTEKDEYRGKNIAKANW